MSESETNLCRAENLLDKLWQRRRDTFMIRVAEGRSIETFLDLSEAEAERTTSHSRALSSAIDSLDVKALPHHVALTIKVGAFQLGIDAQASGRYWLAQDFGTFPAMFPVGAYATTLLFPYILRTFTNFAFGKPGDCDRYLALVEDYACLIDQMREKLNGQAARGVRIPRPALKGMRTVIVGHATAACEQLKVDPKRFAPNARKGSFTDLVSQRIDERVAPAIHALLDSIGEEYGALAPEGVGMAQFVGGESVYEALVSEHLSLPMSIEDVHRAGHDRIAELESEMTEIRVKLRRPDRAEFHRYLLTSRDWVAQSPKELQERFDAALRRIEPHLDQLFRFKPLARYRTTRLDPKLESGMTYGYYNDPMPSHPDGVYYFNASNLQERTLATAPALIYHELVPGHHFHWATQKENELIHPLRQHLLFSAFNEGWAEYAATVAGEIGMYADPCERYGRLLQDAFLTSRLVVDTGMNALGWSLEDARKYMGAHTILSEAEIRSETLRYSTDIPAQSLAYKIGELKMHELRERARSLLGNRFDIRDFHDTVLGSGGMPLEVLEWHVGKWLGGEIGRDSEPATLRSGGTDSH